MTETMQKRPLSRTIRRNALRLFVIFCVVCSLCFLSVPFLELGTIRDSDDQSEALQAELKRLAGEEKEVEASRLAHRGMLGDDGVLPQFEKVGGKLDDQRERLQFVTGQISRLRSAVAAEKSAVEPVQKTTEKDPEVLTVLAQVQLLEEQVMEQ
ncbi:MAG: hypothetical protein FWD53_09205, partial [Phycisphaerales bacterium]|nr:hypothetical protein [Phycisphaerales bacterium]